MTIADIFDEPDEEFRTSQRRTHDGAAINFIYTFASTLWDNQRLSTNLKYAQGIWGNTSE